MIETWRIWAIVILMSLSIMDLGATYYYISKYKNWQGDKPYKVMEMNPLLVFLWNNFGLHIGMIIGSVIILSLNFLIARSAHWVIILIVAMLMTFALGNHFKNIGLLHNLIKMYPTGHLPEETFGKVIGNN